MTGNGEAYLDDVCDCVAYGDEDQTAHQMTCSLWDNNLFAFGQANWNPANQKLELVGGHESLHTASSDEIGGNIGDGNMADDPTSVDEAMAIMGFKPVVVEEDEPDDEELAILDFEDRCTEIEATLWEAFEKDLAVWPIFGYTIDSICRVFDPELGDWHNAVLKCHCDPQQETTCVACGVWRDGATGTYWETTWRPLILRETDIACRCLTGSSMWNCTKCGVKRMPTDSRNSEQLARPMMKWTPAMATKKWKKKAKGSGSVWPHVGAKTIIAPQCRHKGRALLLPNGKTIYGSSCNAPAPEGYVPDFGIYLDSCWFSQQTCLGIALPWQDMGLPKLSREQVDIALDLACRMIDKGDILEVGCIGGHGRTGTFLALVALKNGVETPEEAIVYVREHYCEKAIESDTQEWYVKAWYAEENDLPIPEKPAPKVWSSGGCASGSLEKYQANASLTTKKRNDTSLTWYCPVCNADVDDDANECYWCAAKFSNPGLRTEDEWDVPTVPAKIADLKARLVKPKKQKKRTPPKVEKKKVKVGSGSTTNQTEIPFDEAAEDWGGHF